MHIEYSSHKSIPIMRHFIQSKLQEMANNDQMARKKGLSQAKTEQDLLELKWNLATSVDKINGLILKNLVTAFGWPTLSAYGKGAVNNAWLIAQHADHDVAFQEFCLTRITAAALAGEAPLRHVAYLTDRILVNKKKPQIFYTQFDTKEPIITLPKLCKTEADIEMLNTVRALFNLESIQEYVQKANAVYKKTTS